MVTLQEGCFMVTGGSTTYGRVQNTPLKRKETMTCKYFVCKQRHILDMHNQQIQCNMNMLFTNKVNNLFWLIALCMADSNLIFELLLFLTTFCLFVD